MGTPVSYRGVEQARPELSLMQAAGYDAAAIGNHEFDFTPARAGRGAGRREGRERHVAAAGQQPEIQRGFRRR